MSLAHTKRVPAAAAWMCLLAVTLLYAPLGAAALMANGVGCCGGAYCPIREHHHHKPSPSPDSQPMDCGHDMGAMTACSMSCGENSGRPAVIPGVFVLPPAATVPSAGQVIRPVQVIHSSEIPQGTKPLSPPPRSGAAVL
ncbi:MAG TPA: hypothetical protein VJN42_08145 [Candidatus Acidoferrum sp.]|nr:hypothetical protein [Candidatus Acidoferrum sp.]